MKPCACKHLDHNEATYGEAAELKSVISDGVTVKYWKRRPHMLYEGAPVNVQFCGQGRGRINGIFDCYLGELHCYEPSELEKPCQ